MTAIEFNTRLLNEKQSLKNGLETVAAGVFHLKILFVNAYFVDTPENAPGDAKDARQHDQKQVWQIAFRRRCGRGSEVPGEEQAYFSRRHEGAPYRSRVARD